MVSDELPNEVADFERFFQDAGLVFSAREREEGKFGDYYVSYGNQYLKVFLHRERGIFDVMVMDAANRPDQVYAVSTIRGLFGCEGRMTLHEQLQFVKSHWSEIVRRFGPDEHRETHAQLDRIRADAYARKLEEVKKGRPISDL